MFKISIPSKKPISLIINIARIVTTKPTIPVVIFFLALSKPFLSPPEVIIPIAPVINENTNQIMAIKVMSPTAEEMKVLKISIPLPTLFPKGPMPWNTPKSNAINFVMFIVLEFADGTETSHHEIATYQILLPIQKRLQQQLDLVLFAKSEPKPQQLSCYHPPQT